jgi:hypothetical protein
VFEVQRDDVLPNGMRVMSITTNGVTLRHPSGRNLHLAVTVRNSVLGSAGPGALPPLPSVAPPTLTRVAR